MIRGSCLCQGVRFEIQGEIGRTSHCHCSMCRKSHGAAFATYGTISKTDLYFTTGEALVCRYRSSEQAERWFCSRCGASLFFDYLPRPGMLELALGSLDGDPGTRPSAHIFVGSKAPWYEITDSLPQFDTQPSEDG